MERVERVDRHFQVTVNLRQLEASLPLSHKEEIKSPFAFLFSSHLSRTGFQLPPPPGNSLARKYGKLGGAIPSCNQEVELRSWEVNGELGRAMEKSSKHQVDPVHSKVCLGLTDLSLRVSSYKMGNSW